MLGKSWKGGTRNIEPGRDNRLNFLEPSKISGGVMPGGTHGVRFTCKTGAVSIARMHKYHILHLNLRI